MKKTRSKLILNLKPQYYNASSSSWSTSYVQEHAFPIIPEHFYSKEEFDVAWDNLQALQRVTSQPDPKIRTDMQNILNIMHNALREEFDSVN